MPPEGIADSEIHGYVVKADGVLRQTLIGAGRTKAIVSDIQRDKVSGFQNNLNHNYIGFSVAKFLVCWGGLTTKILWVRATVVPSVTAEAKNLGKMAVPVST